jgi:hypothetical protein
VTAITKRTIARSAGHAAPILANAAELNQFATQALDLEEIAHIAWKYATFVRS